MASLKVLSIHLWHRALFLLHAGLLAHPPAAMSALSSGILETLSPESISVPALRIVVLRRGAKMAEKQQKHDGRVKIGHYVLGDTLGLANIS